MTAFVPHRILRAVALITVPVAAIGSVFFMLHVGQRNPSRLLLALFVGWVLAPFLALAWCHATANRWSAFAQVALHFVTLLLAFSSLLVYGYVAFGPARAQPAFFFLVLPLASLVLIALVAALRVKKNERA